MKTRSNNAWNAILNGEKILSNKEAKEMLKIVKASRKEYGFRE